MEKAAIIEVVVNIHAYPMGDTLGSAPEIELEHSIGCNDVWVLDLFVPIPNDANGRTAIFQGYCIGVTRHAIGGDSIFIEIDK
ncbi:MAG: hypothetical protein ACOYY3_00610 [Chloroflexota bacterium]